MIISLIGMSNSGKSHWSQLLEEHKNFVMFCCDDMIEEKLGPELKELGFSGVSDVGKWMGQPYDERYKENSRKYLDSEIDVMKEIFEEIKKNSYEKVVIDTTGSVVYTGDEILKKLKEISRVIYLETPQSIQNHMLKAYMKYPKPVYWGNSYKIMDGENCTAALVRCYSELLSFRTKLYEGLADLTLDYNELRNSEFNIDDFHNRLL